MSTQNELAKTKAQLKKAREENESLVGIMKYYNLVDRKEFGSQQGPDYDGEPLTSQVNILVPYF